LWAVLVTALLFCCVCFALALNRLHALNYDIDNGTFLQAIAGFGHTGSFFNYGEGRSHMLVHDSWILAVLAPFAAIWPYQQTIIAAQVLLLALSSLALYAFGRTVGLGDWPAALLTIAYLVSPHLQGFAYADFSESHFTPLLVFALAIAVARKQLLWTLVLAQLLCGVKEDLALFLVWFGIAGAIWYDRRLGAGAALVGAANYGAYKLALLAIGAHSTGPNYGIAIWYPHEALVFFALLLVPLLFLPLRLGWPVLLAAPLVVELLFGHVRHALAAVGEHYTELLVALAFIATAIVLRRSPRLAPVILTLSVLSAAFFNVTPLRIGGTLLPADPRYASLRAKLPTIAPMVFDYPDRFAWVVVAGDPNAKILW
jgi:uncharacterized membrane protein